MTPAKAQKERRIARWTVHEQIGTAVFLRAQRRICYLCGNVIHLNDAKSIDHVFPLSISHLNIGNLLIAHRECDQRKGQRQPTPCEVIFLQIVNERLGYNANYSESGAYALAESGIKNGRALAKVCAALKANKCPPEIRERLKVKHKQLTIATSLYTKLMVD